MEKEFIPYDLALRLKALGFDEPCFGIFIKEKLCNYTSPLEIGQSDSINALTTSYSDLIPQAQKDWVVAPLYQQAFRWFRKEHDLKSFIQPIPDDVDTYIFAYGTKVIEHDDLDYLTHEEAEIACLTKLIEIVEK
jgi:hypothetical protein